MTLEQAVALATFLLAEREAYFAHGATAREAVGRLRVAEVRLEASGVTRADQARLLERLDHITPDEALVLLRDWRRAC